MTVFVTSSPFIDGADRAILSEANGFVDRIREALPENPNVVFVASNPEDHRGTCEFAAITTAAFAEKGIHFGSYQILSDQTAGRAYALVSHSDLLVLCGGHVPTQNAFFRKIRLRHQMNKYQGVVLGISAGSMNMAQEVYSQPEEPGESAPEFPRFLPGLGLTWVNILPHCQKARYYTIDGKRLYEDVTFADSMGRTFFALPDGSYFLQEEDRLLLCGESYRIRDGIMEMLTLQGECLDMEYLYRFI